MIATMRSSIERGERGDSHIIVGGYECRFNLNIIALTSFALWIGLTCAGCYSSQKTDDRPVKKEENAQKSDSKQVIDKTNPPFQDTDASSSRESLHIELQPDSANICRGDCIDINAEAYGGYPPYTFSWDHELSSIAGPHHVCPHQDTTYAVTVRDTGVNAQEFPIPAEEVRGQIAIRIHDECATADPRSEDGGSDAGAGEGDGSEKSVLEPIACEHESEPGAKVTTLDTVLSDFVDEDDASMLRIGETVALSGDTLAIAATRSDQRIANGYVFVFVRIDGAWSQQAVLTPPLGEPDNWFGQSLALSGDTLAVGAPEEFFAADSGYGRVHIFVRSASRWEFHQTLTAENPVSDDRFGESLALSEDTLVATACSEFGSRLELFDRTPEGFRRVQTISPLLSEDTTFEQTRVALDGNILAAGVRSWAEENQRQAALVFERRSGQWEYTTELIGDPPGELWYGTAVEVDGNTVAVGDPEQGESEDDGQMTVPYGAVYVFERDCDGVWTQQAFLKGDFSGGSFGAFGQDVAIDGGRIVVANPEDHQHASGIDGAIGRQTENDDYTGAVYVFERNNLEGEKLNYIKPRDVILREKYFGHDVAADSGYIAVGSIGEDAVYLFY